MIWPSPTRTKPKAARRSNTLIRIQKFTICLSRNASVAAPFPRCQCSPTRKRLCAENISHKNRRDCWGFVLGPAPLDAEQALVRTETITRRGTDNKSSDIDKLLAERLHVI